MIDYLRFKWGLKVLRASLQNLIPEYETPGLREKAEADAKLVVEAIPKMASDYRKNWVAYRSFLRETGPTAADELKRRALREEMSLVSAKPKELEPIDENYWAQVFRRAGGSRGKFLTLLSGDMRSWMKRLLEKIGETDRAFWKLLLKEGEVLTSCDFLKEFKSWEWGESQGWGGHENSNLEKSDHLGHQRKMTRRVIRFNSRFYLLISVEYPLLEDSGRKENRSVVITAGDPNRGGHGGRSEIRPVTIYLAAGKWEEPLLWQLSTELSSLEESELKVIDSIEKGR